MKSILDPTFVYVPAAQTDLKKTFARIRKEMKAVKIKEEQKTVITDAQVVKLPRKKGL